MHSGKFIGIAIFFVGAQTWNGSQNIFINSSFLFIYSPYIRRRIYKIMMLHYLRFSLHRRLE